VRHGHVPVGLLDALGARDASFAARVLSGLRRGAAAYGVPVLGGHTQLGVPAALSVMALGRVPGVMPGVPVPGGTQGPVPGGGGRPGHEVRLTVDLGGSWRLGYTGRQWDSTSYRSPAELQAMTRCLAVGAAGGHVANGGPGAAGGRSLADGQRGRPAAAKDVSMAGIAGTLGMLAEASGCGAVLDVAQVPRPAAASVGDWLTCFPGFGLVTASAPGSAMPSAGPAASVACGELVTGVGVRLRWPDGEETVAIDGAVTGLGEAAPAPQSR